MRLTTPGLLPTALATLMASTMLSGTVAIAADTTSASGADTGTQIGEVIVTSEKRAENVQHVAMSIEAIDTKKLSQLNVTNFDDYVKFMPSVQFQTTGPNQSIIYMRGVSDGGNGNHSGPQPTVATYLDEQPITTVGGTLDVHIYDIARVEVLPGPQGTLYGSSSESGTLRIITNKPSTSGFSAGYNVEGNGVEHGAEGYVLEGFVNVPLASNVAIRLVGFDEEDAGYIDNVPGARPFYTSGATANNSAFVKNDINPVQTFGGRAALKWDLNDNWTIMPTFVAQDTRAEGVFGYEPSVGTLDVNRFQPDSDHDRWYQAALNITGKIGRYTLTYSGGYFNRLIDSLSDYTDYSVAYDQAYHSGANWLNSAGKPLQTPLQEIVGRDVFEKGSNEVRLSSPSTDRFRFIVGLFQERQTHWIIQDYEIQGFGAAQLTPGGPLSSLSVPGFPNTIWLTDQDRVDSDQAAFGEATFDVTNHLSITAGIRGYHYDNSLYGFYGFSANYDALTGFGAGQGVGNSACVPGQSFRNAPCVNLDKPDSTGTGETHKVNASYKFDDDKLVYFTYSTGYRPGGVNRSGAFAPYQADSLTNYEVGWKTSWFDRSLNFNGDVYDEDFNNFQFSFLGPNSLTIIENAPSARILGAESNVEWRATQHLTVSGGGAYNDAVLTANFCGTNEATGQFITNCSAAQAQAPKGTVLPYTPKFKGDITLRYTFDLDGWTAHAQTSVVYQTERTAALLTADTTDLGSMPAYATADFSFGGERGNKSVELFIKNAFNSLGEVSRYTPCTTGICAGSYPGVAPAVYVVPIQPLTVGIRFGQKF
jgi:outer membrane receptor protein involved in Fe transport